VGIVLAFGLCVTAGVVHGQDQQTLDDFQEGITLYQTGDYTGAKAAFEKVLARDLSREDVMRMRDMAELGEFLEMTDLPMLKTDAEQMLGLMKRAGEEAEKDVPDPDQLVADLESEDLVTYGKARVELAGHGPYTVPYVYGLLGIEDTAKQYVVGRTASLLAALQRDACLPLARALQGTDDSLLKTRIAQVLAEIGDVRAVPALLAIAEDESVVGDAREAAAAAAAQITGKSAAELGSATEQYVALGQAYFEQNKPVAGYTYALTADIWQWDPDGETDAEKIVYEEVPNYLYYQRMATELALEGLSDDPDEQDLKALLAASLVRQFALCKFFAVEDVRLGGAEIEEQVKQDAADRVAEFEVEVPVVLRMLDGPSLAQGLLMTLSQDDGPASLFLVKTLADKLDAAGPGSLCPQGAAALEAALSSGHKDVRYNAGITLVNASPSADMAPADDVVKVMGAALQAAADRTALIAMNNFDMRNHLVSELRDEGVATSETRAVATHIEHALALEPSVDVIFLGANITEGNLSLVMDLIKSDARTKSAALYLVVDPAADAPDLKKYEMDGILTPDDLRTEKLLPILEETVFAESRSAFTDEEEALVLKAAAAIEGVDPNNTDYPIAQLERALARCLTGYEDAVTAAAIGALARFGGEGAVDPLSKVVADDPNVDLKVGAARAMAAVLGRTQTGAGEDALAVLQDALANGDQALREAAAEALSAAGLPGADVLALIRTEGMGE
jgi:HEAT repeat protein